MFVPVHFFPSTGQRSLVQAEQPACLRPWLAGGRCHLPAVPVPVGSRQTSGRCDGTATCHQAAVQPRCDGPRGGRREAKWKVLQGTLRSPGAGLGSQHLPFPGRMARGEFAAGALACRAHHFLASVINFAHTNATLQMQSQIPANSPYAPAA